MVPSCWWELVCEFQIEFSLERFTQAILVITFSHGRKELSLNRKNKGAVIEKPLFVVQRCLEMVGRRVPSDSASSGKEWLVLNQMSRHLFIG